MEVSTKQHILGETMYRIKRHAAFVSSESAIITGSLGR
jgi:hypothetical protein